uniref:uncharacterized protein LOC122588324 n=1 Tax=Erigeron canadensis TaxID=72917 RepID=UPI001CB8D378|nr:uncharacterized protein LOC122588324 [Erigeron canadensis]
MVKTLKETHKCLQTRDLRKCTARFLAKQLEEQIVPNQKLQAGLIRDQLQKKFKVNVSMHKIYRANKQTKVKLMGDFTEQYRLLRDYLLELQARNLGTTVKLGFENETNPDVQTRQFKRIYICLGPLKRGFQACGRDLLGVDGCFMKGMFPGQLLTTVGVDPNNQIYPLAYGIVESESRSSWTWFLKCLGEDLDLNERQLVDGRGKPVILALEYTREYLMKRIVIVQKEIKKCNGPLTPMATVLFDAIKTEAAKYKATCNGDTEYQVVRPWLDQCVVDIQNKTCSCRKWELTGMPCKHSVAAMWDASDNERPCGIPESYVHRVYRLNTWKEMYKFKICPVPGRTYWPKSNSPITILPPKHHVQIGRPKKKRRKSKVELEIIKAGKLSRQGKTVKCGNCKQNGHNKRGCTLAPKVSSGKEKGVKAKKARIE